MKNADRNDIYRHQGETNGDWLSRMVARDVIMRAAWATRWTVTTLAVQTLAVQELAVAA